MLDAYDARPAAGARLTVVWHHGSPHTGALLPPLLAPAAQRAIRLITYARPGYGGSTLSRRATWRPPPRTSPR
ncbi:hypothetical protein [Cellulomonas sp. ATA003]|uniref:hypothetical protein n=1 Tax=Cellulomonas sp. ATA003 TaxID=3073064 RepID=UPI002873936F|nr:hypothetical protein [Cellulomonas sp. ATA003]WNB86277.1 hypothetical protein REH70_03180 [Cellulomonas sp. ATA003]